MQIFSKKICKYQFFFVPLRRILVNYIIMARPIKETPTLYGEDARRFAYAVEHPKQVSQSEVLRAKEVYESIMRNAAFAF